MGGERPQSCRRQYATQEADPLRAAIPLMVSPSGSPGVSAVALAKAARLVLLPLVAHGPLGRAGAPSTAVARSGVRALPVSCPLCSWVSERPFTGTSRVASPEIPSHHSGRRAYTGRVCGGDHSAQAVWRRWDLHRPVVGLTAICILMQIQGSGSTRFTACIKYLGSPRA